MSNYAHIKRCLELSERDIVSAVEDRRTAKALLDQLARVSRPGDGAPKLLLLFARLATSEVEWIDGALRVEMMGDSDVTVVEVLAELGLGMRERVFPSLKMNVPLDEFARAVERVPHMVAPLKLATATSRRLVLTAAQEDDAEEEAIPREAVSIADESLYVERSPRASSRPKSIPARRGKTLEPAPRTAGLPVAAMSTRPDPMSPNGGVRLASVAVPKAPALPRTEENSPLGTKAIVARVPLTRIQVPRGSRPPAMESSTSHARPSKHPKRASLKPAPKGQSKAPSKHTSKAPPKHTSKAPPKHSKAPPKHSKAPPKHTSKAPPERHSKAPSPSKPARSRAPSALSEPPDEEGIDLGWDDGNSD
jgi:hypothetical protein